MCVKSLRKAFLTYGYPVVTNPRIAECQPSLTFCLRAERLSLEVNTSVDIYVHSSLQKCSFLKAVIEGGAKACKSAGIWCRIVYLKRVLREKLRICNNLEHLEN